MSAKAAELQREVRENAEDYQSYLKSLYKWEEEIKVKDEALKAAKKPAGNQVEFPIRQKVSTASSETAQSTQDTAVHQNKQKAIIEKNKGNDHFKEGKYEKAVECYTAAMELDPADAILPANRAIAFLKLKRFAEAEEDCNKSLSLDPKFVKALHRRGMARANTGQLELAVQDFQKVLSLEPHNKAAQQELDRLQSQSVAEESKPTKKEVRFVPEEPTTKESIKATKVVHYKKTDQQKADVSLDHPSLVELEELLVSNNTASRTEPAVQVPIIAVKDEKQERLAIDQIINQCTVQPQAAPVLRANSSELIVPSAPKNYVQFDQDWKRLAQRSDLQYQYLKQISAAKLPDVFRESLEPDILGGIVAVLKEYCFQDPQQPLLPWLSGLSRVQRIGAVLLFLTSDQKSDLKTLVDHLSESGEGTEEEKKFIAQKLLW